MIPTIQMVNGEKALMVDGKPFTLLGGEVHNSSSSSAVYMEEKVWPYIRGMHLNTLAIPVAWETVEPEEDRFDFTLVDQLLAQARREKMRLILLWFGLWKNAQSTYVPAWVKRDTTRFFRAELHSHLDHHKSACAVSPCCQAAVQADAKAFAALMDHLRQVDERENTVILVQVENEVGLLGTDRDFSPAAQSLFDAPVPQEVAEAFHCSGSWEVSFGYDASSQFMSWCFARALEQIAQAGKAAYPLPMYANAWTVQYPGERPGSYPSGGPVAERMEMWRLAAPSLDFYSPDIYLPDFAAECRKYAQPGNPLFIPEAHKNNSAASYALYAIGAHSAWGFSPFGIEDMQGPVSGFLQGIFQEALGGDPNEDNSQAPAYLGEAYRILETLADRIGQYRNSPRLQGFLQYKDKKVELGFTTYDLRIRYFPKAPNAPLGAGLVLEESLDTFYIAATGCMVDVMPKQGEQCRAEILSLEEGAFKDGEWKANRVLNGDEQYHFFEAMPKLVRLTLHKLTLESKEV